ncbi:MAG: DUF1844 domain-containing protein [Verrucomicrobiota bacterium]
MREPHLPEDQPSNASREEMMSALFANMVLQQTNLALMLLGKVPNPETGQPMQDLDAAKMFIDQLEMLEAKTRGNLDKNKEKLLGQSLTSLRLAFVEAIEAPATAEENESEPIRPPTAPVASNTQEATAPAEEESRKKFTKKY